MWAHGAAALLLAATAVGCRAIAIGGPAGRVWTDQRAYEQRRAARRARNEARQRRAAEARRELERAERASRALRQHRLAEFAAQQDAAAPAVRTAIRRGTFAVGMRAHQARFVAGARGLRYTVQRTVTHSGDHEVWQLRGPRRGRLRLNFTDGILTSFEE